MGKENNRIDYILVFILLCISGNPLFCMSKLSFIVALVVSIIVSLRRGCTYAYSDFIKFYIPFLLLFTCQFVIDDGIKISSILFFSMKILIAFLLIGCINKNFKNTFINVMWFICLVSLVGYILTLTVGILPGISCAKIVNSQVIFCQHIGTYEGLQFRNCGMFWEPGAFAGFICLALAFMLITPSSYSYWFYAPFFIALLTTTSTTGYIVLFIIVVYFILNSNFTKSRTYFYLAISAFLIITAYTGLDFLQNKINSTGSESSRISDYVKYSDEIHQHFIFGRSLILEAENDTNLVASGNGFVWFLISFGIIGVLCYFVPLINSTKFVGRNYSIFFCGCILLLLQGEGFLTTPLFLGIPYAMWWLYEETHSGM